MFAPLLLLLVVVSTLALVTHARELVETSTSFSVDNTGIVRNAAVTNVVSFNAFCEFVLPFLLERGYEPPAYWCN
jgi:hypothetical protein